MPQRASGPAVHQRGSRLSRKNGKPSSCDGNRSSGGAVSSGGAQDGAFSSGGAQHGVDLVAVDIACSRAAARLATRRSAFSVRCAPSDGGFGGSAGAVLGTVECEAGGAASSSLRASGIWLSARLCCSALPIRGAGSFSRDLSRLCLSVSLVVCLSISRAYAAAAGCVEAGCDGCDEAGGEEASCEEAGCDVCDEAGCEEAGGKEAACDGCDEAGCEEADCEEAGCDEASCDEAGSPRRYKGCPPGGDGGGWSCCRTLAYGTELRTA